MTTCIPGIDTHAENAHGSKLSFKASCEDQFESMLWLMQIDVISTLQGTVQSSTFYDNAIRHMDASS